MWVFFGNSHAFSLHIYYSSVTLNGTWTSKIFHIHRKYSFLPSFGRFKSTGIFLNFKKRCLVNILIYKLLLVLRNGFSSWNQPFYSQIRINMEVEKNLAGEFFLLDLSQNWTILSSHLARVFLAFLAFWWKST